MSLMCAATWCGPCKRLEPEYEAMARKHTDVKFYKVMEHEAKELVQSQGASPVYAALADAVWLAQVPAHVGQLVS